MGDERFRATTARLTAAQLDYLCQGLGRTCIHCRNRLDDAPRVCPSISDTGLVHAVARALHTGGDPDG